MKVPYRTMFLFCVALLSSNVAKAQDTIDRSPAPHDHWAYSAVMELMEYNILEGYPDGYFRGKRELTREEFAVGMQRFLAKTPYAITQRANAKKRQIEQQTRLLDMARQIQHLTDKGVDLFAPVPAESPLYPLLAEMQKADIIRDSRAVKAPLTRYDVLLCLRDFRYFWYAEVVRDKRKEKWVSPELHVRIRRLEDEFKADMEAFDALLKKNSWNDEDLPSSVEPLQEALKTQPDASTNPK